MKDRIMLVIVMALTLSRCSAVKENKASFDEFGRIDLEPLPVHEVRFFSESLQRNMVINVVLPRPYHHTRARYPVLYLCHGLTSNYHEFEYVGVPEYLNLFDMIVVMVDAGNSWYVNWARSDGEHPNLFADHVTRDIIGYVDSHYRTVADRNGRAINGISMGGFGAISLGLSHPELFCSIASHSGALGWAAGQRERMEKGGKPWVIWEEVLKDTVTRYRDIQVPGYSSFAERTPKGQPFLAPENADAVDPFKLVLNIPRENLPHIYLDCGTDDGLIAPTREFIKLLTDNRITYQFGQSSGGHEEDYWGREMIVSMSVQYAVMLRNIWDHPFAVYDAWNRY